MFKSLQFMSLCRFQTNKNGKNVLYFADRNTNSQEEMPLRQSRLMIGSHDVMDLLFNSCPSLEELWAPDQMDEFEGVIDEEGSLYRDLALFAELLVEAYRMGMVGEFEAVFMIIELLLHKGSEKVREATTYALIEGIRFIAETRGVPPEGFEPFFLPQSAIKWREIGQF